MNHRLPARPSFGLFILFVLTAFAQVGAANEERPRYSADVKAEAVPDCVVVARDPADAYTVLSLKNECDTEIRLSLIECEKAQCSIQPRTIQPSKKGGADPEALGIDTDRYDDGETVVVRFQLSKRVGSSTDSEWVDAGKLTSTVTFQPRRNGNRGCGGCGVSARGGAPSDWGFGALLLGGLLAAGAARRRWFAR